LDISEISVDSKDPLYLCQAEVQKEVFAVKMDLVDPEAHS